MSGANRRGAGPRRLGRRGGGIPPVGSMSGANRRGAGSTKAAIAAVLAVFAIAPLPARGDAPSGDSVPAQIPDKARTLASRGRAAHDAGDYPTAIAAFI